MHGCVLKKFKSSNYTTFLSSRFNYVTDSEVSIWVLFFSPPIELVELRKLSDTEDFSLGYFSENDYLEFAAVEGWISSSAFVWCVG